MAKKVIVEVGDERVFNEIIEELRKKGVKVRIVPEPEEIRKRIRKRWERIGRRAVPGELRDASLEEEFE